MPNPRTRHSKRRKRARRTHDSAAMPQLAICKTTNETHVYHQAYWHEGNMYYKGAMVLKGKVRAASKDESEE